jgi:hypothetical protein
MTLTVRIRCAEDLDVAAHAVGLPVGPRIGRSKDKKEWYVLLRFLWATIPCGLIEPPITVRKGNPDEPDFEPDFVMARGESTIGLFEITEATMKCDQREMTAIERSGKSVAMPGDFGGRFKCGASRPELSWAKDIVCAIRRKRDKKIFQDSSVARHLLIYPNSNASRLLSDEDHERQAVNVLGAEVSKDAAALSKMANGCLVHVLDEHSVCFDVLGNTTVLTPFESCPQTYDSQIDNAIFAHAWLDE